MLFLFFVKNDTFYFLDIFFFFFFLFCFCFYLLINNKIHFLKFLIILEIMFIIICLLFCIISFIYSNITGEVFSLFILSIAAIESVIGLLIYIGYKKKW